MIKLAKRVTVERVMVAMAKGRDGKNIAVFEEKKPGEQPKDRPFNIFEFIERSNAPKP